MVQHFSTWRGLADCLTRIDIKKNDPQRMQESFLSVSTPEKRKKESSPALLRQQQHVYVMEYAGRDGLILTKIGISKNVPRREEELNGFTIYRKPGKQKTYRTVAVFYTNSDILARQAETAVCNKFKVWTGRELLDTHPTRVIGFVKAITKKMGFSKDDHWIHEDYR